MNSPKLKQFRAAALALAVSPALAFAQSPAQSTQGDTQAGSAGMEQQQGTGQSQGLGPQGADQPALVFEDVEELNDEREELIGRSVTVTGEVEEYVAPGAVVLESGGWFDDEVAVVIPKGVGTSPDMFEEDSELRITGRVVNVPIIEVERELGWDLDPEIEVEIEEGQTYLIADQINAGTS